MNVETLFDIIANQGFPIALSILLIFRIDRFMQEIVVAQNREYYSLRFLEVQKELSGMKAELGKIELTTNLSRYFFTTT